MKILRVKINQKDQVTRYRLSAGESNFNPSVGGSERSRSQVMRVAEKVAAPVRKSEWGQLSRWKPVQCPTEPDRYADHPLTNFFKTTHSPLDVGCQIFTKWPMDIHEMKCLE